MDLLQAPQRLLGQRPERHVPHFWPVSSDQAFGLELIEHGVDPAWRQLAGLSDGVGASELATATVVRLHGLEYNDVVWRESHLRFVEPPIRV